MSPPVEVDNKLEAVHAVHAVHAITATGKRRKYVQHSYYDHSKEIIENITEGDEHTLEMYKMGSIWGTFPIKLQILLKVVEKMGKGHIISWSPHGRSFMIHRPRQFEAEIMSKFFKQTKLTSFHRQLNLYDFQRITHGRDAGAYYHELFLRGRPLLSKRMIRRKVKGTKIRPTTSPDKEPNFYTMPFMGPLRDDATPHDHHTVCAPGKSLLSFLNKGNTTSNDFSTTINDKGKKEGTATTSASAAETTVLPSPTSLLQGKSDYPVQDLLCKSSDIFSLQENIQNTSTLLRLLKGHLNLLQSSYQSPQDIFLHAYNANFRNDSGTLHMPLPYSFPSGIHSGDLQSTTSHLGDIGLFLKTSYDAAAAVQGRGSFTPGSSSTIDIAQIARSAQSHYSNIQATSDEMAMINRRATILYDE